MATKVISIDGEEPIEFQDAKDYLVVEHKKHDRFIEFLIRASRDFVEREIDQDLIQKTRALYLVSFPASIEMFDGPVQSITSIVYKDSNGQQQTLDANTYTLDNVSQPSVLHFDSRPSTCSCPNNIVITYVSGLPQDDVPESAIQMMYLTLGTWYEEKQNDAMGNLKELSLGTSRLRELLKNITV